MGKNKKKNKNNQNGTPAAENSSQIDEQRKGEDVEMQPTEQVNGQDKPEVAKDINTVKEDKSAVEQAGTEKTEEEESNEGVKILQEVFDTKASVSSTGASEDNSSNSSTGGQTQDASSADKDATKKDEEKKAEPASAIGPAPPGDDEYDPEECKKAEEHKTQGNEYVKECKYELALDSYSEAIFCTVPPKKKAIYYCNRALVSIKLENYALALYDAKDAIKNDPTYVKAYYRQGSAHLALNQQENAIADFKTVCKMQPTNKDAREKYEMTMKEHRLKQLQSCLGYDDNRVEIKIDDIQVEPSYTGPKLDKSTDEITPEWCQALMKWQKDRKILHKKYACMIILKAKSIFEDNKSLVDITRADDEEITVCGDIHGQYYDLLNIFEINGVPSKVNPYLFNGDFIDRGSFSVEVIMCLLSWKVCYPNHFFMSRGNHETRNLNKLYGFEGEVKAKYDLKVYDFFNEMFQYLPLSHCINKKVFVTHGGIFAKDGVKLEDIRKTKRDKEPGDEGIMVDCLWSDPCDQNGRHPSKRGISVMFGPDVTQNFLDNNDLKLVVRSHEVKPLGYEYQKGGKCLTVFSAPNYCDQMGNKGAFVRFKGKDMEPQIESFEKVDHPKIPPMAYANRFGGLF